MNEMPRQIGKYEVLRELGSGGFGAVYLARDPKLGEEVAIKLFRVRDASSLARITSATSDAEQVLRTRFLDEARVLRRLTDARHVITLYEFDELDDGTPWYAMPYLPRSLRDEIGRDLQGAMTIAEAPVEERPRALALPRALLVLDQLAQALADVHRAGLIHRDVKPANLLFDASGDLKLADFGIAKVPDTELSTTGHAIGSLRYMAPEQHESAKHVLPAADIYATGVIAYRMLTGAVPVGVVQPLGQLVPAASEALVELVMRCLDVRPEARPQDGAALLAELRALAPQVAEPDAEATFTQAGRLEAPDQPAIAELRREVRAALQETGELDAAQRTQLRMQAAVAGLDSAAFDAFVAEVEHAEAETLAPLRRFFGVVRAQVAERGTLTPADREALAKAGAMAGLDAARSEAIVAAALVDAGPATVAPTSDAERNGSGSGSTSGERGGAKAPSAPPKRRLRGLAIGLGLAFGALFIFAVLDPGLVRGLRGSFAGADAQSAGREVAVPARAPSAASAAQAAAGVRGTAGAASGGSGADAEQATQEAEARSLITRIEADIAARRLTSPAGDNAMERITELAGLDAAAADALRGRVALAYVELAEAALAAGERASAERHVSRLAIVDGDQAELPRLRARLAALALAETGPQVGSRFRDDLRSGGEGPELVVVPAGRFRMGCVSGDGCQINEMPVHEVRIAEPFAVGVYEVTFAEYERYARAKGVSVPDDEGWGRGRRPVINVNWEDAQGYVRWLSEETGKRYRLLSESEWEYVGRAGSETKYYFGRSESELCRYGNGADQTISYGNQSCSDGLGRQSAVIGRYEPNEFGLYDTIGNVWEWTQDCWNESYSGAPRDGVAWTRGDCGFHVLRGGSWSDGPQYLRSAYRVRYTATGRLYGIGFRVAQDF